MTDKSINKRYKEFMKLYMVRNVKYKNPQGEVITETNVPVVLVSDSYFIVFNKDAVKIINWEYFISIEHKLDERQMNMAARTSESVEDDIRMFSREKSAHDPGVG